MVWSHFVSLGFWLVTDFFVARVQIMADILRRSNKAVFIEYFQDSLGGCGRVVPRNLRNQMKWPFSSGRTNAQIRSKTE